MIDEEDVCRKKTGGGGVSSKLGVRGDIITILEQHPISFLLVNMIFVRFSRGMP